MSIVGIILINIDFRCLYGMKFLGPVKLISLRMERRLQVGKWKKKNLITETSDLMTTHYGDVLQDSSTFSYYYCKL